MTERSATEPRRCPDDGDAMKREEAWGGVVLDRCGECDGLWFDGGEIARWAAGRGREPADAAIAATPSSTTVAGSSRRACPACVGAMLEFRSWNGAALGRCDRCGGLFVPPALQQSLDRPVPPGPPRPAPVEPPRDVPTWGEIAVFALGVLRLGARVLGQR